MPSAASTLLRRHRHNSRLRWALPLLRLCVTSKTNDNNHHCCHHSLADAFAPPPTLLRAGGTVLRPKSPFATSTPGRPGSRCRSPRSRSAVVGRSSPESDDSDDDSGPLPNDWSSLRVVELRDELRNRGLRVSGKKADLVARLLGEDDGGTQNGGPEKKPTPTTAPRTASPTKKKKKGASDHQRITDRDVLPKLWTEKRARDRGSVTYKIASWNVAGLRALVRNHPTALADLCRIYDLDMLCLQETKLQESHLEDPKLKLKGMLEGYDEYWSCSTAKKGYSGTCVYVKKRSETLLTPASVGYSLGREIDNEGRIIVVEFPWATVVNVYVPNSGQNLQRLEYRTNEWDKFFLEFLQTKQHQRNLPVMWLGDLNIAHQSYDVWNDGAKHLAKQAGVTAAERQSFTDQLDAGFADVFRRLHPEAKGNYSYWSQRAGNRAPNKGLRLDYFVASETMFDKDHSSAIPRDSYMIPDQLGSDHAPVVLELELRGSLSSQNAE